MMLPQFHVCFWRMTACSRMYGVATLSVSDALDWISLVYCMCRGRARCCFRVVSFMKSVTHGPAGTLDPEQIS